MFAVLEFWDFFWIWVLFTLVAGGFVTSMARLEAKVDLVIKHLGLVYPQSTTEILTPAGKRGIMVGMIAIALLLVFIIFRWI